MHVRLHLLVLLCVYMCACGVCTFVVRLCVHAHDESITQVRAGLRVSCTPACGRGARGTVHPAVSCCSDTGFIVHVCVCMCVCACVCMCVCVCACVCVYVCV